MAEVTYDIHKAALIIVEDRKVLATRTRGKSIFIQPGGKLEEKETEVEAAIREAREELGIEISQDNLEKIGDYYADAAGQPGKGLRLAAFMVKSYSGKITPRAEVEEVRGFNSHVPDDVELGSILEHDIMPVLKARDLID